MMAYISVVTIKTKNHSIHKAKKNKQTNIFNESLAVMLQFIIVYLLPLFEHE